ncbi:hypothetical protein FGO68_gene4442 [Halteria grandinella]|uniref:Uncharacterized protein n=1 Tax=Halteria grandinella TaxID=5974 RepID=A0A8J8NQT5_HALGN|nr:hypothetical protein FGO68_gene4442 [Halteria grandinella]
MPPDNYGLENENRKIESNDFNKQQQQIQQAKEEINTWVDLGEWELLGPEDQLSQRIKCIQTGDTGTFDFATQAVKWDNQVPSIQQELQPSPVINPSGHLNLLMKLAHANERMAFDQAPKLHTDLASLQHKQSGNQNSKQGQRRRQVQDQADSDDDHGQIEQVQTRYGDYLVKNHAQVEKLFGHLMWASKNFVNEPRIFVAQGVSRDQAQRKMKGFAHKYSATMEGPKQVRFQGVVCDMYEFDLVN